MILVDEARWPAHGTVWGHVVSDASLPELHAFARAAGLPVRGFDHDHYDYPHARRRDLIALGALPVSSTELLRRLRAAGLRVRPAQKTPSRAEASVRLRAAGSALFPGRKALRDELLERWSEPHRRYHDLRHLASCLAALGALDCDDRLVHLAAWFHDAIYTGQAGDDEEASARLAEQLLPDAVGAAEAAEVARLVRLTTLHDPDLADDAGCLLSDADLSILAVGEGRYHVYLRDVRLDYAHVPDQAFRAGRRAVVERLLATEPLFRTHRGFDLWEDAARANLTAELGG